MKNGDHLPTDAGVDFGSLTGVTFVSSNRPYFGLNTCGPEHASGRN
jgi:hypothetical protein